MLAGAAACFLLSSGLSFVALRRRHQARWTALDHVADYVFFLAMALLLVVCVLIAFAS
jgi:hypothetical protein